MLGGVPSVSSHAQSYGTAHHALQEAWLIHSKHYPDTPMGRLAKLSVPHMPAPGTEGLKVEQRVFVPGDGKRWTFAGTPDLRVSTPTTALLLDHKTTGSLKYALSAAALEVDAQFLIYGSATLKESGCSALTARWIYSKKGDENPTQDNILVREIVNHVTKIENKVNALRIIGQEMVNAIDKKAEALSLPPNFKECGKYGGCPHRSKCGVKMTDYEKQKEENKMATDRLKALLDAKRNAGVPVVVPSDEASITRMTEAIVDTVVNELAEGINPPDAAEALVDPPEAAPKEKKTRAKKVVAADAHIAVNVESGGTLKTPEFTYESQPAGFTVYADCVVSGEHSFISFRDLVAEAEQTVNTAFSVADYRLVEYGRGAGALVAAVKTLLADLKGGNILVDLSSPSQRVCFDALCAVASTVVRGIR
jgi:hypothetical protein